MFRKTAVLALGCAALLLSGGSSVTTAAEGDATTSTEMQLLNSWIWSREYSWSQPEGLSAVAAQLSESHDRGAVSRLFVLTPSGRRIVLTNTMDPLTGVTTCSLLDDETGWTLEVTERIDLSPAPLAEWVRRSLHSSRTVDDLRPVVIEAPGLPVYESELPWNPEGAATLARELVERRKLAAFLRQVPEGLPEAVAFLDAALGRMPHDDGYRFYEGSEWRQQVAILARLLEAGGMSAAPTSPAQWELELGPLQHKEEERESLGKFFSQFKSLEDGDPWRGHTVHDLLDAAPESGSAASAGGGQGE